jgi:transcriptional regulator
MYNPAHFREERLEVLQQLISRHRLATLVTLGSDGLIANHVPLIHHPDPAPLGALRGHLARPNPQWRDSSPVVEALAIFQGPDAYISPSWYPTKSETGRVVPTWNYAVVHAYGPLQTFDDPSWLEQHVRELVNLQEAELREPWKVDDAPPDFIQGMLKGIVGIEMQITRLEGKWKMSQNRPARDQAGVIQVLRTSADPALQAVADLIAEWHPE